MTAPLSGGQFPEPKTKGMMGGPRDTKGRDGSGNMAAISGTTRGNLVSSWFWNQYPYVIGGLTDYDPNATMPGSNLQALGPSVEQSQLKAGGGPTEAQIPDYGGTTY